uniref:Uncharacterized protein n=1 Tax=Trichuris muris TaxID=70415 RepID=A0A5S6R6C5_TRIMR
MQIDAGLFKFDCGFFLCKSSARADEQEAVYCKKQKQKAKGKEAKSKSEGGRRQRSYIALLDLRICRPTGAEKPWQVHQGESFHIPRAPITCSRKGDGDCTKAAALMF